MTDVQETLNGISHGCCFGIINGRKRVKLCGTITRTVSGKTRNDSKLKMHKAIATFMLNTVVETGSLNKNT